VQMFLATQNALIVLGAILIGGILGELMRIEDHVQSLGSWLEKRITGSSEGIESRFVRAFLTASLVFCVGPMAILGSIQDGMTGNYQTLIVKAILDGFGALAFASTLGVGVLFSTLVLLVYQGSISLLAAQLSGIMSPAMMAEMNAVGGVILFGIAISSMLEIKKIRVGNFLPGLVIAPLIVALLAWIRL